MYNSNCDNQKKLTNTKLSRKTKRNLSPQLNVLKPKPIKKIISNRNEANELYNEEADFSKKITYEENCTENSLGQLTKNFIKYIRENGKKSVNINDLVNELSIKKRRIYDITNVLQGIGYIQKNCKNEISWVKTNVHQKKKTKKNNAEKKIEQISKQKSNIEFLIKQNSQLKKKLDAFFDEFTSISQRVDFLQYAYITMDDIESLAKNLNKDFVLIKANNGNEVKILEDGEAKKVYENERNKMEKGLIPKDELLLQILQKENHLFFESLKNKLKLFHVKNGVINEISDYIKKNNNENSDFNFKIDFNNKENNKDSKFVIEKGESIFGVSVVKNNKKNIGAKNGEYKVTVNNEEKNIAIFTTPNKAINSNVNSCSTKFDEKNISSANCIYKINNVLNSPITAK